MRKALCAGGFALAALLVSVHVVSAGAERRATQNGDINGDGRINISDPVDLLRYLFGQSDAPPAHIECPNVEPKPAMRFEDLGETVFDHETGLEWWKEPSEPLTFFEAQGRAASGGNGWRLPTMRELFSLVDHSRWAPAGNTSAFVWDIGRGMSYWSSDEFVRRGPGSPAGVWRWVIGFHEGETGRLHYEEVIRLRAVREATAPAR